MQKSFLKGSNYSFNGYSIDDDGSFIILHGLADTEQIANKLAVKVHETILQLQPKLKPLLPLHNKIQSFEVILYEASSNEFQITSPILDQKSMMYMINLLDELDDDTYFTRQESNENNTSSLSPSPCKLNP